MKYRYTIFLFVVGIVFHLNAQSLVSISPNQQTAGSTLTALVSASGLYFMSGSPQGIQGIDLSSANCAFISGSNIQVLDDDHANVDFTLPADFTNGSYDVNVQEGASSTNYNLPAAYTVTGGMDRSLLSVTPGIINAGNTITLSISGTNIQSMIESGNPVIQLTNSNSFVLIGSNVVIVDANDITADFTAASWADNGFYDLSVTCNIGCFKLAASVQIQGGQQGAIVSVQPNQGAVGTILTAQVTGSNLYFMSGSPVGPSDIYLQNNLICNQPYIQGQNISITDDDHLNVDFDIPADNSNGFYDLILTMTDGINYHQYELPQGFQVTGGVNRGIVSINPYQGNRAQLLTAIVTGQNIQFMVSTQTDFSIEFNNEAGSLFTVPAGVSTVIDSDHVSAPIDIPYNATAGFYDVKVYYNSCMYLLPWGFEVKGNVISGGVYLDIDSNGVRNGSEYYLSNKKVMLLPDSTISFTDINGIYHFGVDSGGYQIKYLPDSNWVQTSLPLSYSLVVNNTDTSGIDFGTHAIVPSYKVNASLTGMSARCNWDRSYYLSYSNYSTNSTHGSVMLQLDSDLVFVSSIPSPDVINGYFLQWNYDSLRVNETRNIEAIVHIPASEGTILKSTLCVSALDSLGGNLASDCDTLNQVVSCSYDPNDKTVVPSGVQAAHYVLKNQDLEYLVRFQNTGSDTAFMVLIRDTIDSHLDINSLTVIASSHPIMTTIKPGHVVEFRFNNINLPYEGVDELHSHGFVKYNIHAIAGTPDQTVVSNTANIYFDLNSGVQTNVVTSTLVSSLSIGISEIESQTSELTIYPNPATNRLNVLCYDEKVKRLKIDIYTGMEQKIKSLVLENPMRPASIDISDLAAGIYYVTATDDNRMVGTKKLVIIR